MVYDAEMRRLVSGALVRLRAHSPFFAALALFAGIHASETIPTAATDGRDIFVNRAFLARLTPAQRAGVILHEVLHAALRHVSRRGTRDPLLWNIAADIVVNGLIAQEPAYELPLGTIRKRQLEHLSVEAVYHALRTDERYRSLVLEVAWQDLLDGGFGVGGILDERRSAKLDEHWRHALDQAQTVARTLGHGTAPAGLARELDSLREAQLDWRAYLWRFLVRTPSDFQGFDRRFVGRGLYLEALDGDAVRVYVCVDTSGSVGDQEMGTFLSEVRGILGAYPHVECQLYYADAACHGPYPLTAGDQPPKPIGGGGTDFRPFFAAVAEQQRAVGDVAVCVYLTDGMGTFPSVAPDPPVLWVLTPGGIEVARVPFGEAVRLPYDE
jgi:predicted metal-dependent peptidase